MLQNNYWAPVPNVDETLGFYKEESLRFKRHQDYKAFLTKCLASEKEHLANIKSAVEKGQGSGWHLGNIYRGVHVAVQKRIVDKLVQLRQKF